MGSPVQVVVNHVRQSPEDLARLTHYVADAAGGLPGKTVILVP